MSKKNEKINTLAENLFGIDTPPLNIDGAPADGNPVKKRTAKKSKATPAIETPIRISQSFFNTFTYWAQKIADGDDGCSDNLANELRTTFLIKDTAPLLKKLRSKDGYRKFCRVLSKVNFLVEEKNGRLRRLTPDGELQDNTPTVKAPPTVEPPTDIDHSPRGADTQTPAADTPIIDNAAANIAPTDIDVSPSVDADAKGTHAVTIAHAPIEPPIEPPKSTPAPPIDDKSRAPFERAAIDAAKPFLADYLASIGHPVGADRKLNCICQGHADSEPSMHLNANHTVHCYGCGFHGDIIDVIAEVEGLTPKSAEAINRAIEWAGTGDLRQAPRGTASSTKKKSEPKNAPELDEKIQAVHSRIARGIGHIFETKPIDFLHSRGFNDEDIDRLTKQFHLGYGTFKKKVKTKNDADKEQFIEVMIDALIIPHGAVPEGKKFPAGLDYYTARAVDPDSPYRFNANANTPVKLFNPAALKEPCCFICEGAIDALSIVACGFHACATGGAQGKKALRAELDALDADKLPCLIIAFDNDDNETGSKSAKKLSNELVDHYLTTVTIATPPDEHHDMNDAFRADRDGLTRYLQAKIELAIDVHNHPQDLTTPFGDSITNADLSDHIVAPNEVTDNSVAQYIVTSYPQTIRFNTDAGKFMVYEPPVWSTLGKDAELRFILDRFRNDIKDSTRRIDKRIVRALQSTAKGNAVIGQFYSFRHLRISDEDLNRHPMLINVLNGTVDLTNGQLLEHTGQHLWTKVANVVFDPHARSDVFDKFIRDILPDDDTRLAVQSFLGYCLTGSVIEEKALFIHGSGGNGKGTLLGTVQKALGDYAKPLRIDCLLAGRRSADAQSASPEFNKLLHTRLAVSDEVPANQKLDAAQFKLLTGGDALPIRLLHHEATEIKEPSHKLILSGNYLPQLSDAKDEGLKRRLLVVRFPANFSDQNRDPTLKSRLTQPEALSAVFNWLLEGCLRWQKEGLHASKLMQEEVSLYLDANDIVSDFLNTYCKRGENFSVSRKVLLDHVKRYADFELRSRRDSDIIDAVCKAMNVKKEDVCHRVKSGYVIKGIDILSDDEIAADAAAAPRTPRDDDDFISSADFE